MSLETHQCFQWWRSIIHCYTSTFCSLRFSRINIFSPPKDIPTLKIWSHNLVQSEKLIYRKLIRHFIRRFQLVEKPTWSETLSQFCSSTCRMGEQNPFTVSRLSVALLQVGEQTRSETNRYVLSKTKWIKHRVRVYIEKEIKSSIKIV